MSQRAVLAFVVLTASVSSGWAQSASTSPAKPPSIIAEVRAAIAQGDFALGEQKLADYRAANGGWNAAALEALSWLGRGALAADKLDEAEQYARETQRLCVEQLASRALDAERNLPIALGAAIEVQAHVAAARGDRSGAIHVLREELARYRDTSIATRIQKNINLLSLEGQAAPAYDVAQSFGVAPTLGDLKGRPAILFFWAHWCPDCKVMAPVLAKLQEMYRDEGLAVIGPTQRYGWVRFGTAASVDEEMAHIDKVRQQAYGVIREFPVPVGEETFKVYGCSTTPTVVLVDRQGIVRLYHPGQMTFEELEPRVRALVSGASTSSAAQ